MLENVFLASELVNGYHKVSNSDRATVKFDISKAFDTVKWSFITLVLKAMGLPPQFILSWSVYLLQLSLFLLTGVWRGISQAREESVRDALSHLISMSY